MVIEYKPGRETGYRGLLTVDNEKFWVSEETGEVEKYSPVLNLAEVKSYREGLPDLEKLLESLSDWCDPYDDLKKATQNLYDAFCRSAGGEKIPMNDMYDLVVSFADAMAFLPMEESAEELWKEFCSLGKDIYRASSCFLVEHCMNWRCKDNG